MLALTVLAFVVIIISSSKRVKAADKAAVVTELKDVKHINKIVAIGNVEVFITQGTKESLKVYDKYYSKNALVQWEAGELRIASFEKKKLTIEVTVNNLSSIEASGQAVVRTMNELSAINLDINLKDYATAQLEAKAVSINSALEGGSKLELSGESESQHLALDGAAQYEATRFTSPTRSMLLSEGTAASVSQDMKSTSIKSSAGIVAKGNALVFDLE